MSGSRSRSTTTARRSRSTSSEARRSFVVAIPPSLSHRRCSKECAFMHHAARERSGDGRGRGLGEGARRGGLFFGVRVRAWPCVAHAAASKKAVRRNDARVTSCGRRCARSAPPLGLRTSGEDRGGSSPASPSAALSKLECMRLQRVSAWRDASAGGEPRRLDDLVPATTALRRLFRSSSTSIAASAAQ